MGELSSRFSRTKQLFRRSSATTTTTTAASSSSHPLAAGEQHRSNNNSPSSTTTTSTPPTNANTFRTKSSPIRLHRHSLKSHHTAPAEHSPLESQPVAGGQPNANAFPASPLHQEEDVAAVHTPVGTTVSPPELTFQAASPEHKPPVVKSRGFATPSNKARDLPGHPLAPPTPQSQPTTPANLAQTDTTHLSPSPPRTSNEVIIRQAAPVTASKEVGVAPQSARGVANKGSEDYFGGAVFSPRESGRMAKRKIWVKRTGQSATLVQIAEDDLVDDVRDMIIRKYANSLGRTFDAPDVALRIVPREKGHPDRTLGPEEEVVLTLEAYYPGGQHVEEALIIEVPQRRTPRPSPQPQYIYDQSQQPQAASVLHHRPAESGTDYFPQMPAVSPGGGPPPSSHDSRHSQFSAQHPHSISILETGQAPPLPSPRLRSHAHRPRTTRQNTSSPTSVATSQGAHRPNRPRGSSNADMNVAPAPPPLPTPPLTTDPRAPTNVDPLTGQPGSPTPIQPVAASAASAAQAGTPPVEHHRVSPRIPRRRNRRQTAPHLDPQDALHALLPPGVLDGGVPPINVLIVEDNIINLKLLEQLAKRLKVRWQTAMNGRDAVAKWRTGGFHLVLMDIQLPIMSGLEATKEIRRLERVNGIGVFAKSEGERRESATTRSATTAHDGETNGVDATDGVNGDSTKASEADDKLTEGVIFQSPVIIVALTASSLQSDRHEALAAGCNDFLTKPVNFVWFERKVMEWGCMQALIDFDGWRKWKDQAAQEEKAKAAKDSTLDPEDKARREKKEKRRMELMAKMGQTAKA